jgi:hypothetical protein
VWAVKLFATPVASASLLCENKQHEVNRLAMLPIADATPMLQQRSLPAAACSLQIGQMASSLQKKNLQLIFGALHAQYPPRIPRVSIQAQDAP